MIKASKLKIHNIFARRDGGRQVFKNINREKEVQLNE